ncbi:MAG: hypothetical protein RIB67_01745 [Miltoncostaeaceae bacterium]
MPPLAPVEVIERRRRGEPLDAESITAFMRAWLDGVADDAQMAAWCMAAGLEPARLEEVDALARALVASGDRLDLSSFGPTGDVQSTGAVGETASFAAIPIAAALGVTISSIGAASVGFSGGLIDRVVAIRGFDTEPELPAFVRALRAAGCALMAPGRRLVTAAPRLDELRDATATGSGVAPTMATLMARALAGGAGCIVLAVPVGRGAALADAGEGDAAIALARSLAEPWGRSVRAVVLDADTVPGLAVGAALEVGEVGAVLRGEGPSRVRDGALALAGALAEGAGVAGAEEALAAAEAALDDGRALRAAERWVEAQGGDPSVWTDPALLGTARHRVPVCAPRAGVVDDIDPRGLGEAARWTGAGRLHASQIIDPTAGVEILVPVGTPVEADQPVLMIHTSDAWLAERAHALAVPRISVGPGGEGAGA